MLLQSVRSFFTDLVTDNYERDLVGMTQDQVKRARRNHRMYRLKMMICFCGTAMFQWSIKADLLNKLYLYNHSAAYICSIYFTFALVSMLLGIIASSFPDSAPFAEPISWNGALQAFVFAIASFHLTTMEYHENVQHMFISFVLTSTLFGVFWYFCAQDPKESGMVKNKSC